MLNECASKNEMHVAFNGEQIAVAKEVVMKIQLILIGVIAVIASFVALVAPALATSYSAAISGGPGGGPFFIACPGGTWLTGLNIRSGGWIDAVGGICRRYDQVAQVFTGNEISTSMTGGHGGSPITVKCRRANETITAVKIGFTRNGDRPKWLDYIEMHCSAMTGTGQDVNCIGTGDGCWDHHPNYSGHGRLSFWSDCYANERPTFSSFGAVGLAGRSGQFIDSFGLQCALFDYPPPNIHGGLSKKVK